MSMKDLFRSYYRPTEDEFKTIWSTGIFALDTNILLNLYRYPVSARDELLGVLGQLSGRLWVPFHVAMEYQRTRLSVIAEQKKKFHEVRKVVARVESTLTSEFEQLQLTKRHSSIEPDDFINDVKRVIADFMKKLEELDATQMTVSDEDDIRAATEKLLNGRIGPPPEKQESLDAIYAEGEIRYDRRSPPGYMDGYKEEEGNTFVYGGLAYRQKFGDLIIWKQLIQHAKDAKVKHLVFLTDDDKEDWWWIVDAEGKQTIGPRPELVDEMVRLVGTQFYMYNSERFLKYAKKYLAADVSEQSITQVRDTMETFRRPPDIDAFRHQSQLAERLVYEWLSGMFDTALIEKNRQGFPDFVVHQRDTGRKRGFEVKLVRHPARLNMLLKEHVYRAYYEVQEGNLDEVTLVCIVPEDSPHIDQILRIAHEGIAQRPNGIRVVIGVLARDDSGQGEFLHVVDMF